MELEYSDNVRLAHETLLNVKKAILMLQEWNESVTGTDEWLSSPMGMQRLAGNAMMIEVIGEEVKKVEKRLGIEFLNQRSEIPWKEVIAMRNRISHGYHDLDTEYMDDIIKNDLAPLLEAVEYLIKITDELYLTV